MVPEGEGLSPGCTPRPPFTENGTKASLPADQHPVSLTPHTGRKPPRGFCSQLPASLQEFWNGICKGEHFTLLFSGSLLYGKWHQPSPKKQLRSVVDGKGGTYDKLQTHRAWENGKLLFLTLEAVRLTYMSLLISTEMTNLEGQHTEPSRCPLKTWLSGVAAVRHQSPPWAETWTKTEEAGGLGKGRPQVDCRQSRILASPSELGN